MCVYDDVKGWNTLPYLEQANFIWIYDFDVTITAPANHIKSGGELVNPSEVYTAEQLNRWALAAKATRQL
jgi:hypothetical protein